MVLMDPPRFSGRFTVWGARLPPNPVHVATPNLAQPFARTKGLRNPAEPKQNPGCWVSAYRVKIGQFPFTPGQRRNHRPQHLPVRGVATSDLDPDRLARKFAQFDSRGGLDPNRYAAEGRLAQIDEFKLDLRWVDISFLRGSHAKLSCRKILFSYASLDGGNLFDESVRSLSRD